MELKKKTIIWEDNNEPPKDYIWVKTDGKAYEFDYNDRKWKESTSINVNNNDSDSGDSDDTPAEYNNNQFARDVLNEEIQTYSEEDIPDITDLVYADVYVYDNSFDGNTGRDLVNQGQFVEPDDYAEFTANLWRIIPLYEEQPDIINNSYLGNYAGNGYFVMRKDSTTIRIEQRTFNNRTYYHVVD